MASSSQLRATSFTPKNPTKDFLLWENKELKRWIKAMEEEIEELKKGKTAQNTNPWRTPSPVEGRVPRETVSEVWKIWSAKWWTVARREEWKGRLTLKKRRIGVSLSWSR